MPDLDDDSPAPLLCEDCRQLKCVCATSVADVDAWADAYLGSEAQAQDYFQARTTAQRMLAGLHAGRPERSRSPAYLEELTQGDDTC